MGLLGVCNAYTMRVCLNMAITQMVNRTKPVEAPHGVAICPSDDELSGKNSTPHINPVSKTTNYIIIRSRKLKLRKFKTE